MTDSNLALKARKKVGALICYADVEPERVEWLWPGRIPLGGLTVLDGDPGLGKSTLTIELAARVSRGERLPGTPIGWDPEPAGALLISVEDLPGHTIRPRLDAAGADLTRVHSPNITVASGPPTFPRDIEWLINRAKEIEAKLIVLDPLVTMLGGINAHKDQEVRLALAPLAAAAAELNAAIVMIRHLNKAGHGAALYRGGGSIGIVGAARAGLMVAKDPDNPDHRILAPTKMNLCREPSALRYHLVGCGDGVARVEWLGETDHQADNLVQAGAPQTAEESGALKEAREFLRGVLADGPMNVGSDKSEPGDSSVYGQAKAAGINWSAVKRARSALGIVPRRHLGVWRMSLPDEPKAPLKGNKR